MSLAKFFSNPRNIIAATVIVILALILLKIATSPKVLGQNSQEPYPSASTVPTPTTEATTSASPETKTTPKSSYKIAVYGDSMVDTMGENLEFLQKALLSIYPATTFNFYNYGIGSQNVENGLTRFEKEFANKERKYPSIVELKPDIIVLGSFAYNPFPQHDAQKHLTLLGQLATKSLKVTPNVYLLAEIAPLKENFGKGEHGVNWPPETAAAHGAKIVEQLENAQNLAKAKNLTLVDAFSQTQENGKFGSVAYVDGNDGIHPSVRGHVLMANMIARGIKF